MYLDPAIDRVLRDGLRREGWPDLAKEHPADRGGLTRGGVTAKNWGAYKGLGRSATKAELNALTDDDVLEFYFTRYVQLPGFMEVPDPKLRALCVDWAFTSWFDDPVKAVQTSLRTRGLYDGPVDGVLGPRTRAAMKADTDPARTYREVLNARIVFYLHVAFDDAVWHFLRDQPTTQLHNLRGWINRCLEFTP